MGDEENRMPKNARREKNSKKESEREREKKRETEREREREQPEKEQQYNMGRQGGRSHYTKRSLPHIYIYINFNALLSSTHTPCTSQRGRGRDQLSGMFLVLGEWGSSIRLGHVANPSGKRRK